MFGSKIRSWMENHIGRPKKKGNKNKNGNSGNLAATNTPNGHTKKSSHQGDSSIGSPARRREVSPIQNHATSRVGWQSPQEVAMSPHSDHFGYRQMVKSSSSPRNMPRKTTQPSTYSKSVDEKSLGKGGPVPLNPFCKQLSNVPEIESHSKRSTIAANLSFNSSSSPFATMSFSTSSASSGISTDPSFHRTLQPSELKNGKSIECFRGKCTDKENLRKNADIEAYSSSGHYVNPQEEESRYGKILPRKNDDILDRYDTVNANVHLEACLRGPVKKNPTFGAILSAGGLKGTIVEVNRNILRMNQQQRCTSNGLMPPANHLAHVINSLSSPESAYSTGYSTDGTSPGASYTPEYYINMRTGTHYFPKGANGMMIESNRYKYGGLNKIDEGGANSSGCESV